MKIARTRRSTKRPKMAHKNYTFFWCFNKLAKTIWRTWEETCRKYTCVGSRKSSGILVRSRKNLSRRMYNEGQQAVIVLGGTKFTAKKTMLSKLMAGI